MGGGKRTARMMAGLAESLEGTLMFICRFVGLDPKSETRVRALLAVPKRAAKPPKVEVEMCMVLVSCVCGRFLVVLSVVSYIAGIGT